ncbi:MAG: dethiobiotin synthase [Oscillospiraceae bacterium]|nr:dethiobiotin synthase [Oscillospiraceae bacterium]
MHKGIFITGTGTDVGKTFVTALLVRQLAETGGTAYFKAAMSGNEYGADGNMIPGDALFVKTVSGIGQPLSSMCPYVYERAVSPHLAARIEENPVELANVTAQYAALCSEYEYVVCEGSGGIVCPIRFDETQLFLKDIIKALDLPCLIVADAGLGTINSVVLTCDYMKSHGLEVRGLIFNHFHKGDVMEEDNKRMCEMLTGLPVVACVGDDAASLGISTESLKALCSGGECT